MLADQPVEPVESPAPTSARAKLSTSWWRSVVAAPVRIVQHPVGWCPVEVAVWVDHLRLDPDAELACRACGPGRRAAAARRGSGPGWATSRRARPCRRRAGRTSRRRRRTARRPGRPPCGRVRADRPRRRRTRSPPRSCTARAAPPPGAAAHGRGRGGARRGSRRRSRRRCTRRARAGWSAPRPASRRQVAPECPKPAVTAARPSKHRCALSRQLPLQARATLHTAPCSSVAVPSSTMIHGLAWWPVCPCRLPRVSSPPGSGSRRSWLSAAQAPQTAL